MYTNYTIKCGAHGGYLRKILLIMKITTFIIFAVILQVSAAGFAQKVTLSSNNSRLTEVFNEIRNQTGYDFLFTSETLKDARRVTIKVENAELKDVLNQLFTNQPLEYIINKKAVIVSKKEAPSFLDRVVDAFTPPVDVRGTVVDEKGMPLPGANVKVKGFKQAAVTDNEGRFYLPGVDDKAVLVVSFVGYKDVEVGVKASLNVVMELKAAELEEVVVAYGKTTQQALTGAVTVVKGEQIQNLPNRSFDKSLQGLVPGLLVTSGNGQPGSGPGNFVLRGIATGAQPTDGQTFRNPLIVIDGIPISQEPSSAIVGSSALTPRVTNPLAQLNPSDIESISVLKDAAAIALYGSKASNGVILVITKKGKVGKTTFNFRHQTDIASALDGKIKMLNQHEYLELLFETYHNSNPATTDAKIYSDLRKKFPIIVNAPGDTSFYPQADWAGALLNKNAVTIANEISVSGGTDYSNFYLNFEYTKEDGVTKKTGYDRKSMRFNYENRPASWFKLGLNSTFSYNVQEYTAGSTFLTTVGISPLNPIRNGNGDYIYQYSWGQGSRGLLGPNAVAQGELDINKSSAYRGMSNLSTQVKLFKELNFTSSLGGNFSFNDIKGKRHPLLYTDGGGIAEQLFRTTGLINTNLLQFNKVWRNAHNLNLLAGQEARIDLNKYSFIRKVDISDAPDQDQLQGVKVTTDATGNTSKQTQASYFGQLVYSFLERYYLSGSIRTDGSSQFGKNNRFGTYWSIGGGWVASNEFFLKRANNWLSFLKLRGSMGPAGNSAAIVDRLRFDQLNRANFMGGVVVFPQGGTNPGNPSIQWEETFTWDAGLELRLLKDRFSVTIDVYNRKTKNLIAYDIEAPFATGYDKFTKNIGDVKNHGLELSLTANLLRSKNFQWDINANWSRNRNKLTRSFLPSSNVSGTNFLVNSVGYEYNSFSLKKWAGVNPANGRPMWIDSLGNPTENWLLAKPEIVGKAQPDGFGSVNNTFNYKGFGLSVSLYYQYGSQIYLNSNLQNDGNRSAAGGGGAQDPYFNQTKGALDRWRKPGDIASNPRRLLNGQVLTSSGSQTDQGTAASTRYLYDGDFIRLANVQLNYSLPKQFAQRLSLNSINLFVQGHNLATWTKYSGDDPENVGPSGFGNILYPQSRSYSVGLNVNF
jgi:TonB-linked SusC/RagA family outer membrane protein